MKNILFPLFVCILSLACSSNSKKMLSGHNYDEGDWLFVHVNYAENTLQIIDDEKILKRSTGGIYHTEEASCDGKTCDGFLRLYKDGNLIIEKTYLSRNRIIESAFIKKNYKKGFEKKIFPSNPKDFDKKWDSLKTEQFYPTSYLVKPENQKILWVYSWTK